MLLELLEKMKNNTNPFYPQVNPILQIGKSCILNYLVLQVACLTIGIGYTLNILFSSFK